MEPVPGYAAANWEKGYGDFVMKPDMATLRRLPWLPGTALVLADILDHHHHEDVPHAPRAILKKQIARLAAVKMSAFFASELEFYLFDETYDSAADKRYHDLKTAGRYIEDYHILQTTKEEGVMRAIRNGLHGAGIPVENSKGEWGPGQEEINVRYADALTMADRHVILKNGIKEIALLQGKAVTFMAKWRYDLAGSSSHIHNSLWDRRRQEAAVRRREGRARHVAADAPLHRRPARLTPARSPGSWRPTSIPTSASRPAPSRRPRRSGRSTTAPPASACAGRTPRRIRIECRIGGADLNPYLAFAALIAAGLAGIEQKLELEAPYRRRCLSRQAAARGAQDAARGDGADGQVEDAARRLRRRRSSTTTSTPPSGSSSNTTAASPTGS